MKTALVGYGYWGKMLEKYIKANPALELVKVYSPELEVKDIYTNDVSDVEDADEIEVVFIATPVDTHYDLCKRFLLKNKHVFCEKPATKTLDELQELKELAEKMGRILYIDYLYMNSPSINYIKDHIQEIGKVHHVEGCIEQFGNFYPEDDVYEVIGVHIVSGILYMLGADGIENIDFESYLCTNNKNAVYGETSFMVDGEVSAKVKCNLISNHKVRTIRFYGEKGYFLYDMNGENTIEKMLYQVAETDVKQQSVELKTFDEHNTLERVIGSFVESIGSGDAKLNNQVALHVQKWLEEARRIYRSE